MDKQSRYKTIMKEDLIFKSIHTHYNDNEILMEKIKKLMEMESFQKQQNVSWLHKESLFVTNTFSK